MNVMRDTLLRVIRRRETEYQNRPGGSMTRTDFVFTGENTISFSSIPLLTRKAG